MEYCNTQVMIADMMTKALNPKRLKKLTTMCKCQKIMEEVKVEEKAYVVLGNYSSGSVVIMEDSEQVPSPVSVDERKILDANCETVPNVSGTVQMPYATVVGLRGVNPYDDHYT